jgi:hypothetical protein
MAPIETRGSILELRQFVGSLDADEGAAVARERSAVGVLRQRVVGVKAEPGLEAARRFHEQPVILAETVVSDDVERRQVRERSNELC